MLRLAPGEEVLLLDGQGRSGRFAIAETAKKKARLVLQEEQMAPAPESRAVMALAFSKAVRRGFFMEKAVELGAHAIWLWQGDHSQGKLPADAAEACRGQMCIRDRHGGFGLPWHEPRTFHIRVSSNAADYVRERIWATNQQIEDCEDGGLILTLTTRSEPELRAWVRSFGDAAVLLEDDTPREQG